MKKILLETGAKESLGFKPVQFCWNNSDLIERPKVLVINRGNNA